MTKVMLLGDIHGDYSFFFKQVLPAAIEAKVSWIYQVGDFGYWEHTDEGKLFLDDLSKSLTTTGINLLFVAGNHDKTSLIPRKYNMIQGFYLVRPGLWFAPNGTQWEFAGKKFLALGGAYSIDKDWRIEQEQARARNLFIQRKQQAFQYPDTYIAAQAREEVAETLWFPEEEMTDSEVDEILSNLTAEDVDVILAHDKPFASNPGIELSPIAECIPNQRRLQKAVLALKPKLFVHGHLHVRYTDDIRCGDDNAFTRVEGLGANVKNFNQYASAWRANHAWEILNLED